MRGARIEPAGPGGERGAASVSLLLVAGVVGLILYAALAAASTEPDRYGRMPVPSAATISFPGAETGISWVGPAGDAVPPADLRIDVIDPVSRQPLRVNSKGGDAITEGGESLQPVARFDPPAAGPYEVRATSAEAARRPGAQLAFGESAAGAVGDRLGAVRDVLKGPVGIGFGLLLLAMLVLPALQRRLRD